MLKEKIIQDVKNALKAGDVVKRSTLVMLISAIKNRELEKRSLIAKSDAESHDLEKESELTDEEVVKAVASEVKKRKESIETYEKGGRPELAEKERQELGVLSAYMPEQLSDDDVLSLVKSVISDLGAQDIRAMGKVTGQVMAKAHGKTDGQTVSRIVKEELLKNV